MKTKSEYYQAINQQKKLFPKEPTFVPTINKKIL